MHRDATSQEQDSAYAPPAMLMGQSARVRLGGAALEVIPIGASRVALRLGTDDDGHHAAGTALASDVRNWCRSIRLLLDTSLALPPGDEVELRSPMLLVDGIGCLALWRWLGGPQTTLRLLMAHSPEQLVAGDETAVLFVSAAEVHALSGALVAAASADGAGPA